MPWDGSSGLTCQNVVDVVITNYCQRQPRKLCSSVLAWTKTRNFACVDDTSTEPHHRFEMAFHGERFFQRPREGLEPKTSMLIASCSERHVARMWQRYAAISLLWRSDYLHVRGNIRRLDCAIHHASSLSLFYNWPPSVTIFVHPHVSHRAFQKEL